MADIPRLNGVIKALEAGKPAFTCFATAEVERRDRHELGPKYDGIVFEMEHNPWDIRALRDALQYMLNRRQIVAARATLAPAVTPMVRIPPNGGEKNQWLAKQALDLGAYGIVWPHISTVEQAYNAVAACRYPRLKTAPLYEPAGLRGDGPTQAVRYWGLTQQEYYERADVWPLNPKGEIFVILHDGGHRGHRQPAPTSSSKVPGIGVHPDRRGRSFPGTRLSAPVRASGSARVDGPRGGDLQEAQRGGRASPCGRQQRRAHLQRGLHLPDGAPVQTFGGLNKGRELTGR